MKRYLAVAGLAALAGCTAQPSPEQQMAMARNQMAIDDARCVSYGFGRGSDTYAKCRLILDTGRERREMASRSTSYNQPNGYTWRPPAALAQSYQTLQPMLNNGVNGLVW